MSVGKRLVPPSGSGCGTNNRKQYGRVERVYIDRHGAAPKVFVKFTSQLSALRVSQPNTGLKNNY
jgi:splicing factor 45